MSESDVGGEFDKEILLVPVCVILSLGLWSSIDALGPGRTDMPFG